MITVSPPENVIFVAELGVPIAQVITDRSGMNAFDTVGLHGIENGMRRHGAMS